jgi:DNA-binding transcriptional MerR regulator
MDKSPEAFRTISEVAEALETPAHVLRFWESRFPQIRPVKRAGGRRYYRPADVALLTGIKRLLHDEGMTIRGVQKILREQGIRLVAGLSDATSPEEAALDEAMVARFDTETEIGPEEAEEVTAAALEAALDPGPEAMELPGPEEMPAADDGQMEAEPSQASMDWLVSLPKAPGQAHEDDALGLSLADRELTPASTKPVREVGTGQNFSAAFAKIRPDEVNATLAARLRALPKGSLNSKQEEVAAISERLADLRARLSGLRPQR